MLRLLEPPLSPDADEARELLANELAKPAYQQRETNWFDYLMQQLFEWIAGIGVPSETGNVLLITIILLAILGVVIAAFLVFGKPRLNRKSRVELDLFGETESRSAAELRKDASKQAASGNWDEAVVLQFRAMARSMSERTIVTLTPGMTARRFAQTLGSSFPQAATRLEQAVGSFDEVRYLERPGTQKDYEYLRDLDAELAAATPQRFAELQGLSS